MWQIVSDFVVDSVGKAGGAMETVFPVNRQRQLTIGVAILILCIGIFLLASITWADIFYS